MGEESSRMDVTSFSEGIKEKKYVVMVNEVDVMPGFKFDNSGPSLFAGLAPTDFHRCQASGGPPSSGRQCCHIQRGSDLPPPQKKIKLILLPSLFFSSQVLPQLTSQVVQEIDALLGNKPNTKKESRA